MQGFGSAIPLPALRTTVRLSMGGWGRGRKQNETKRLQKASNLPNLSVKNICKLEADCRAVTTVAGGGKWGAGARNWEGCGSEEGERARQRWSGDLIPPPQGYRC